MPEKFNILLITSDSQRTDSLSCMGSPFAYSPCFDKLAEQGVLFTQAHSAAPVCMPARCSIMTGLHTPLHGCMENGLRPREGLIFFTDYLKKEGYINIIAGKTHFGPVPSSFDIQYITEGEKSIESNIVNEHSDSLIADNTINAIENVKKTGKPFFAFCSFRSPHSPVDPPGKWLTEKIFKNEIPLPNFTSNEWMNLPPSLKEFCGLPNTSQKKSKYPENIIEARGNVADALGIDEIKAYNELYYRSTAFIDSLTGRLVGYLDDSGLRRNTLVIFTSDHGLQNYDHGFNDKHNYYDESFRVPFIMSLPGTLPENEKREFASHVDIAPTIMAAAGLKSGFTNGFDLFTPLINNEKNPRHFAAASLYGSLAIVTNKWKFEYYYLDDQFRLFDRINDRKETHNLSSDPHYHEVVSYLTHALLLWRTGLADSAEIRKSADRGGPVAMRVIKKVKAENGNENEKNTEIFLSREPQQCLNPI